MLHHLYNNHDICWYIRESDTSAKWLYHMNIDLKIAEIAVIVIKLSLSRLWSPASLGISILQIREPIGFIWYKNWSLRSMSGYFDRVILTENGKGAIVFLVKHNLYLFNISCTRMILTRDLRTHKFPRYHVGPRWAPCWPHEHCYQVWPTSDRRELLRSTASARVSIPLFLD